MATNERIWLRNTFNLASRRSDRECCFRVRASTEGLEDESFEARALIDIFERTGGIITVEEAEEMLARLASDATVGIARLIARNRLTSFFSGSSHLVPLFQFCPLTMSVVAPVPAVIDELAGVLESGEMCSWFARGNAWLGGASPAELVREAPGRVVDAARADRFVLRG